MAVNSDRLGDALKAFVDSLTEEQLTDVQYLQRGVANEILSEITTNGVVTINIDGTDYTGTIS